MQLLIVRMPVEHGLSDEGLKDFQCKLSDLGEVCNFCYIIFFEWQAETIQFEYPKNCVVAGGDLAMLKSKVAAL